MTIIKRFISFFIASAIALTSSGVRSVTVYAAESTSSSPWVTSNKTINSGDTINYTQGMEVGYLSAITFKNDGVVNVTGGSFNMNCSSAFENNGTFSFTGNSETFSLGYTSTSFVNNGTAKIKGVYNFGAQDGTSFINNGTLYLEDISSFNSDGFVNNGYIVVPDGDENFRSFIELKLQNKGDGSICTQTEFENKKLRYPINYEGLSADDYYDYNNPNPTTYEWAAADPQNVTLADPTLGGYEFLGWTGLDVAEPTKNFTFSSSVCKEVTFTAHWKPIVYTITYDLDGGSFSVGQTPPAEYMRGNQKGIPSPYKNGYTFNGWIDADSGEQVSTASERYYYMPPSTLGDKTYKASFIANSDTKYNVICYYQNIDGTYKEEKYLFTGETGTQVSVSKENYDKVGFAFDEDNSGNLLSGEIKPDNSLELKLYFSRNRYTVTFKSQDGSETLWTTTKYYDEKVGEYGGEIPSKASDNDLYEYVFDNWAREEPNRDFGYAVNDVVVTENITFYAAFKSVRDESIVVIKWEKYDGFNAPAQTEIRLEKGADYTAELQLENEKYYVGTREWILGFQEAHIYWYDVQSGEHGIEYSIDKENFESPVTLTITNVQHDIFIKVKAKYHEEHDYSPADDEIIENGGCINDSVIRHFCYKCGKTDDETVSAGGHVTDTAFETDKVSHWKICNICNEKIGLEAHTPDEGVVTHEPTHSSTGTKTFTCTVCGYVTSREILEMIPHAPVGDWQSNAKTHYKTCSCGAILDETPHTPDNGTVTLEPTYDEEGKREYRCTVCGYLTGEETLAPLGHNVDDEWQSDVSGHWRNCECGEQHNFGEHISDGGLVTIEPTYDSWGERVFSCTICGYVLRTETILPLSHKTDGEWVFDKDNHWKEGCGCGEKHELSSHISDNGTVTLYPTGTEEGKMEYRCTVCGYLIGEERIAPLVHNIYDEWQSDASGHWQDCECGEKHSFGEHISDDGVITTEPTYDSSGERVFSCTVCGYILRTETIPALGGGSHTPSNPSVPSVSFEIPELPEPSEPTEPVITDIPVTASRPDNGVPFIKNDSEKNGWEEIGTEAENAAEGSIITVDMNGTTVVPGYVTNTVTGRDVTLVFDMGDGITWSVNGKSVTARKVGNIDFEVKTNTGRIPAEVINNVSGERPSVQLSLAHNGEFGFTAVLSVNIGKDSAGLYAMLYYYDNGGLELIGDSGISDEGIAQFVFSHASEYLVVIDNKPINDIKQPDSSGESEAPAPPESGDKDLPSEKNDDNDPNDCNPETGENGRLRKIAFFGCLITIMGTFLLKRNKFKTQ